MLKADKTILVVKAEKDGKLRLRANGPEEDAMPFHARSPVYQDRACDT